MIPEGVTSIGNYAFENCTSLASVIIPDTVTIIEWGAFENCTSLKSITIPDSVTEMQSNIFSGCTSLESVTISNSVTTINGNTFSGCTSLKSVTIPKKVTYIGDAFKDCTSLETVTIYNSKTYIDETAFEGCTSFNGVTLVQGTGLIIANAPTYSDVENLLTLDTSDSEKITFTAADGYLSYYWYVDDIEQSETDTTFTMNISDYSSGYYTVMLVADKYSATVQVTVSK